VLLATDPRSRVLALNTVLLAAATATASVALGAPLAFLIARTDIVGRRLATIVLLALLFTPLYLQAAAWQAGFAVQGWYTLWAGGPALLTGWRGAIAIHTAAALPWVVLIMGVGFRLAEPELEEEALLDATPSRVFRRVTLRRAGETVAVALVWVAVTTAGEMTVTDLFLIRTYAEEIYTQFALGDTPQAAVWNLLPSIIATAWLIVAGLFVANRIVAPDRYVSQRQARAFRLGRWRGPASAAVLGAVALVTVIPLASLLVKAGRVVTRGAEGLERGWSAEQCLAMIVTSPLRFSRELGWTTAIGALAATAAVAIGLPLAWNARRGGWRALPAWLAIAAGLAVPGPLIGLGLIGLFNWPDWPWLVWLYDHSVAAIWMAQTIRALPLTTLVLWFALRTIPGELLASATLEGASPLVRFVRIVLPQRLPAVAAAWLVALAVSWGELAAGILVVPPGVMTLPIQVFGLIHYGVDDQVAGVSLAVSVILIAIALILAVLARAASRER
jgi:iron(III) transport system permease protein